MDLNNHAMDIVQLAARDATVLWDGDVAVLGAGLAGLTVATAAAHAGQKVCLLDPGPTLGREVSREWLNLIPSGDMTAQLLALCDTQNARCGSRVDILVATLAFDRLAHEAGVQALVCVQPMRPLPGPGGNLAGVEVVGKSGRQAVKGRTIIDATAGRTFTRRVLGLPMPAAATVERRLYLHGVDAAAQPQPLQLPAGLGIESADIRAALWPREALLSYRVRVAPDASRAGILAQTQHAALAITAWLRAHLPAFAHAILVDISPDFRPEYDGTDLAIPCQALAGTGLAMLPLAADLAEELRLAAKLAAARPWAQAVCVPLRPEGTGAAVELLATAELHAAPEQDQAPIVLPAASARRHAPRDVVVAGCGAAGAMAAGAAAEQEVTVTVLDPAGMPGGIATAGRVHCYYFGVPGGMQDRIDELTRKRGAEVCPDVQGFHPLVKGCELFRCLADRGVEFFAGHVVFGVVTQGPRITALLSAAEDGYHVSPCSVAIDATGDGDVAAAAGVPFTLGRESDGFTPPYSYTPSLVADGRLTHHNFDVGWVDPTDTADFSRAHFEGRRCLWDYGPFSAAQHYCTLASVLGLRGSRFIHGRYRLTLDDFLDGKSHPDTICEGYAHHDNHAVDYADESDWAWRYVVLCGLWAAQVRGEVPYAALVPLETHGLLLACRAISVDPDLHHLLRMQRDMQKLGEVAGTAAALAVRSRVPPHMVEISQLRERLSRRGVLPDCGTQPLLSLPRAELLARLGSEQNGLAMWRLSRLPAAAAPDWPAFFRSETDPHRAFCAAVAVAAGGRHEASAAAELREVVRKRAPGPSLGLHSPPPFVLAALALAEMGDADAADRLGELLSTAKLDPPTVGLVLRGLAKAGRPAGIAPIRDFLHRTEHEDFPVPLSGCAPDRRTSLRFAVVQRAVATLHALGSRAEDQRLEPYLNHENLLIRRQARRTQCA